MQNQLYYSLSNDAIHNNFPIECGFELTSRCTFQCKMCYVHTNNSEELIRQELSTEQWTDIFDQAYNAGMLYAILTGGECLLRSDFKKLYLHLFNLGIRITINTNASILSSDYVEFFKSYPPNKIQISLYGPSEDIYYDVTRTRSYQRVVDAIDLLLAAGINVKIVFTICKYNYSSLEDLILFAKNRHLPYSVVSDLIPSKENPSQEYQLSFDEYVETKKLQAKYRNKAPKNSRDTTSVTTDKEFYIRCKAGRSCAFINWHGKMQLCASLPEIQEDVFENRYVNAWNAINHYARNVELPDKCSKCEYDYVCPKCPAVRSGGLLKTECNEFLCRVTEYCSQKQLL